VHSAQWTGAFYRRDLGSDSGDQLREPRAGHAGAGFAVVADEVCSTAQCGAQAASNGTVLIEDLIIKFRTGRGKVDQVTSAIRTITGDAGKIKQLVDDIDKGHQG
jgi:methyl-accepting chemotaxis protein